MNENGYTTPVLDLLLEVLAAAMLVPLLVSVVTSSMDMSRMSLITKDDKAAVYSVGDIQPKEPVMTRDDVLMACVVVDKYVLTPRVMKIGTTTVPINSQFMSDRTSALNAVLTELPTRDPIKMELEVNPDGLVAWNYQYR